MLRKISVILVIAASILNFWLVGLHKGFELGGEQSRGFTILHSGYEFLVQLYSQIILLLFVFLFGKLI
jgi:hypothetical protein